MTRKLFPFLLISTLLLGCGSSNEDSVVDKALPEVEVPDTTLPEVTTPTYTGVFLDSAVQGLTYTTETQSGITNELGEFSFKTGELITFNIGNITLPVVAADLYITPLEIFETNSVNDIQVVNLLRLLQSLDVDGDASNGIEINEATRIQAESLLANIDFSSEGFDQQVAEIVAQSGALNTALITSSMAIDHFQQTLNKLSETTVSDCTSTHEKVGYSGYFSTLAHNVSGLATIIDDCTIEVTQFSYDGGGPEVFFYGAIDHQYASSDAFALGSKLTGTVFNDGKITLKLPQGKSLDDLTGLSVWCVDFDANFGQMEFTP